MTLKSTCQTCTLYSVHSTGTVPMHNNLLIFIIIRIHMDLHFGRPLRHGSTFHIRIPREITPKNFINLFIEKNQNQGLKPLFEE